MTYASFIRQGAGVHPVMDLAPLRQTIDEEKEWGHVVIASPQHLAHWELRRSRLGPPSDQAQPVDLFVWAAGEGPQRRSTRVGGTPFLPAATDWPEFDDKPATFLAQFDFGDSRDLFPELPGDLLLVFIRDEDFVFGEPEQFQFRWVTVTDEALIAPEDCPPPFFLFFTGHAIRHRSFEDPGFHAVLDSQGNEEEMHLPVAPASKIGGLRLDANSIESEVPMGTRHLCTLASIQAICKVPWPFANTERAMQWGFDAGRQNHPSNVLMISDMGWLSFVLSDDGEVGVLSDTF